MTRRQGRAAALGAIILAASLVAGTVFAGELDPLNPLDPKVRATVYRMVMHDETALYAKIRAALEDRLSNPETCAIRFFPKSKAELLQGRFERIEVDMEGTVIKALRVRQGRMVLHDFVLNYNELFLRNKVRFRRQGKVDFFLHVIEYDLNRMLLEKGHKMKLRNPHIDLLDGFVKFRGLVRVLFFKNRVKVRGRLYVRDGVKVIFSPGTMQLDFLPLPTFIVRKISAKINPIADLSDFRVKLDCSIVEVRPGHLFLASASGQAWIDEARKKLEARDGEKAAGAPSKPSVPASAGSAKPEEASKR